MSKKYKKDEVVKGVIDFIKDSSREEDLIEVASELGSLVTSSKSLKTVHVYSAVSLDQDVLDKIKEKVEKIIGHNIIIRETTDKRLLGGIKIKIGDWVYDASIQSQLNSLKNELYANI